MQYFLGLISGLVLLSLLSGAYYLGSRIDRGFLNEGVY